MSDDLDRFVLQYTVDLRDSISRLEKLNAQVDKTGKGGDKAKGKFAELKGALTDLHPALGKAVSLMGDMGRTAGLAAIGVGGVMAMVKMTTSAMKDYNVQLALARQSGMGTVSIEGITRNLSAASGGRVTREMSRQTIGSVSDTLMSAYTDPSRMNEANRALRMFGVSPVGKGGQIADTQDVMNQLGARWAKQTKEQAEAEGMFLKLAPQATDAIRALGGRVSDMGNMSVEAARRHAQATEASQVLQASLSGLHEDFTKIGNSLTDELMPPMAAFFKLIKEGADGAAKAAGATSDFLDNAREGHGEGFLHHLDRFLNMREADNASGKKRSISEQWKDSEADSKKNETAKQVASQQDQSMKTLHDASAQIALAANLFSGAVQSFSSAPGMEQSLAAWAGEIGKAAGLPGSSNAALPGTNAANGGSRGLRNNNPGNLEYGDFAKANGATGTDGRFAVFPSMEAGTAAHEALLSKNYLAKGLNTPSKIVSKYAPANENDQAKYLDFLKSRGFAPDASINGKNLSSFVAAQEAYESGYGSGHGIGESKDKVRKRMVQQNIADYLHVPLDQVQRGGVNQGDANWALRQKEAGINNGIFDLKKQLMNPMLPAQSRAKLQLDLRDQQRGLALMQQYGAGVAAQQAPGDRTRTRGEMPIININVNGSQDPKATAAEVQKQLQKAFNDLLYNYSSGVKG